MPALHLILASTCGHPLRYSTDLEPTNLALDFDAPYCHGCLSTTSINREYEAAKAAHNAFCQKKGVEKKLRLASCRHFRAAKVALLRDRSTRAQLHYAEKIEELDYGPCEGGLPIPPATEANSPSSQSEMDWQLPEQPSLLENRKKSVRFADDPTTPHRPEMHYRQESTFFRTCPVYRHGRWADWSGEGFEDTSNPNGEPDGGQMDLDDAEEEDEEEEDSQEETNWDEFDAELMELTDEEFTKRERDIETVLARFGTGQGGRTIRGNVTGSGI